MNDSYLLTPAQRLQEERVLRTQQKNQVEIRTLRNCPQSIALCVTGEEI